MYNSILDWTLSYFSCKIIGCTSVSAFVSSIGIPKRITSTAIACAITERIQIYKSIIMKRKINHDKIILLAKSKLNRIEVLTLSFNWFKY